MQITPVDSDNNLFKIENVFDTDLVQQILATDWLNIHWHRQEGQENWARRRLDNTALPWIATWDQQINQAWESIQQQIGISIVPYFGTAFWLDEDKFICPIHTDGELPGSLHMNWIGPATAFYWYKDSKSLRYQFEAQPNTGYIMVNQSDNTEYRKLLWHGMLTPVKNFRVTSYTWMVPQ